MQENIKIARKLKGNELFKAIIKILSYIFFKKTKIQYSYQWPENKSYINIKVIK
jgi:hypothetical protein